MKMEDGRKTYGGGMSFGGSRVPREILVGVVVFAFCGLTGFLAGEIFKANVREADAASINIEVTNNDYVISVDASNSSIIIERTSVVKVTNPRASNGYVLSARIAQNTPSASIVMYPQGGTSPFSACSSSSPCTLSAGAAIGILASTNSAVAGDTTEWTVMMTLPAGTAVGNYLIDIEYTEEYLNCNSGAVTQSCIVDIDPNMVPIVYTGNTIVSGWAKADVNVNWYDYGAHKWANAVTLDNTTDKYDCGGGANTCTALAYFRDSAASGVSIPDVDVLGYWVYIPRFAYQVQRYAIANSVVASQTQWNVRFQKATDAKLYAQSYTGSGAYSSGVSAENRWQTHPAFTYGSTELNGLWIGKYETGDTWGFCTHDGNANCGASYIGNARGARAQIKPDMSPMTMQRVAYQYQTAIGMVGFHNLTSAETRVSVTKDSEWSSASYLSNSQFGIYNTDGSAYYPPEFGGTVPSTNKVWNNAQCSTAGKSVSGNGCLNLTAPTPSGGKLTSTGHGPAGTVAAPTDAATDVVPDAYSRHFTLRGMLASTTHNIYGVYDMAAGVWEYQMSAYTNTSGGPFTGENNTFNSGFLFNGERNCNASACTASGTAPNLNVTAAVPFYYVAPGATVADKASSPAFDFYDQRQFTNNDFQTNYNQCDFVSCGGRGTMEVMTVSPFTATNWGASWNGDYSIFVRTTAPWSSRGGPVASALRAGVWSMYRDYGHGTWSNGWRAVQSRF